MQEYNIIDTSIDYYPSVELSVRGSVHSKDNQPFIDKISPLFEMIQLTCLDIYCSDVAVPMLIKILNFLANIHSMRISDLPLPEEIFDCNDDIDIDMFNLFLKNNKITKVTLRNISGLEQIDFILDIFPRMQYLALQKISNIDLKLIVQSTLLKIKEKNIYRPMKTCVVVVVVEATNNKIQQLQKLIDSKNLFQNYTLNRQYDRIYLQWK